MAELADAQRSERCELLARGGSTPLFGTICGRGGIWYTRTIEVRVPQGVEVQVLSSAQILGAGRRS